MPSLIWRKASDLWQLPARSSLSNGFGVCMEGRRYTGGLPDSFDLWRMYSPIVGACAQGIRRRPPGKHLDDDTWNANDIGGGVVRTEPLPLKVSRVTGTHRWQFTDGRSWSQPVRTVRFVDLRLGGHLRSPSVLPVDVEVGVEATVPTGLADPNFRLSLVVPWQRPESEERTIRDLLSDEITETDGTMDDELNSALGDFLNDYLWDEPPEGWELSVEPDALGIEPGSTGAGVVRVKTGQPGGVAVAVEAVDIDDRERRGYSDVFVVERDEDGTVTVLYVGE